MALISYRLGYCGIGVRPALRSDHRSIHPHVGVHVYPYVFLQGLLWHMCSEPEPILLIIHDMDIDHAVRKLHKSSGQNDTQYIMRTGLTRRTAELSTVFAQAP